MKDKHLFYTGLFTITFSSFFVVIFNLNIETKILVIFLNLMLSVFLYNLAVKLRYE
jgi:fluoride ion exporter CrcB/FEX